MSSFSIEDYPFIIRFKTSWATPPKTPKLLISIEDYPFIIRFKTIIIHSFSFKFNSIEDYPFIIRFKTVAVFYYPKYGLEVLRTIHL